MENEDFLDNYVVVQYNNLSTFLMKNELMLLVILIENIDLFNVSNFVMSKTPKSDIIEYNPLVDAYNDCTVTYKLDYVYSEYKKWKITS